MAASKKNGGIRKVSHDDCKVGQGAIEGLSILLPHQVSSKSKRVMLGNIIKRVPDKKERSPIRDAMEALYLLSPEGEKLSANTLPDYDPALDDLTTETYLDPFPLDFLEGYRFGFPAPALSQAVARAGKSAGYAMTDLRCAIHFRASGTHGLIEVTSPNVPVMQCDFAPLPGKGGADLRFRAGLFPWRAEFEVVFDSAVVSGEQLFALIGKAGQTVGICDWRLEKNGTYGAFKLTEACVLEKVESVPIEVVAV